MTWDEWLIQLSQQRGVFVTGTDTNVGKTWVGSRLLAQLCQRRNVVARKPVESGWNPDVTQTDAWKLAHITGQSIDQTCKYRLTAPLSPPRAAALMGLQLTLADLTATCQTTENEFLYVEGAGGFYSPLTIDGLNADLAVALKLPILLISEDKVGCISTILLIEEAIKHRALRCAGIILNPRATAPEGMDNLTDLRERLSVPVFRYPN